MRIDQYKKIVKLAFDIFGTNIIIDHLMIKIIKLNKKLILLNHLFFL